MQQAEEALANADRIVNIRTFGGLSRCRLAADRRRRGRDEHRVQS